ncbi:MAG: hypothetical protein ACI3YC_08705 [Alloprevotella sp.]
MSNARRGCLTLVGAGGSAPCRLALPDRVCIRPSLCLKRVPRFKQKRPACGGVFPQKATVPADSVGGQ